GDHDALVAVQLVTGAAFADAREFAERHATIAANPNLSLSGRAAELAKFDAQRETVGGNIWRRSSARSTQHRWRGQVARRRYGVLSICRCYKRGDPARQP
ncbi:MAG: hypothetical protein M3468_05030, partial [Acidobacteriota bacterium]|nr:hypothetical protein [Acidobacteriota bacterium]